MSWAPDRAPERGMGYGVGQPYGGAPGRGAYAAAPRRDEIEELTGPERFASATSFRKRDPMDVNPHRRHSRVYRDVKFQLTRLEAASRALASSGLRHADDAKGSVEAALETLAVAGHAAPASWSLGALDATVTAAAKEARVRGFRLGHATQALPRKDPWDPPSRPSAPSAQTAGTTAGAKGAAQTTTATTAATAKPTAAAGAEDGAAELGVTARDGRSHAPGHAQGTHGELEPARVSLQDGIAATPQRLVPQGFAGPIAESLPGAAQGRGDPSKAGGASWDDSDPHAAGELGVRVSGQDAGGAWPSAPTPKWGVAAQQGTRAARQPTVAEEAARYTAPSIPEAMAYRRAVHASEVVMERKETGAAGARPGAGAGAGAGAMVAVAVEPRRATRAALTAAHGPGAALYLASLGLLVGALTAMWAPSLFWLLALNLGSYTDATGAAVSDVGVFKFTRAPPQPAGASLGALLWDTTLSAQENFQRRIDMFGAGAKTTIPIENFLYIVQGFVLFGALVFAACVYAFAAVAAARRVDAERASLKSPYEVSRFTALVQRLPRRQMTAAEVADWAGKAAGGAMVVECHLLLDDRELMWALRERQWLEGVLGRARAAAMRRQGRAGHVKELGQAMGRLDAAIDKLKSRSDPACLGALVTFAWEADRDAFLAVGERGGLAFRRARVRLAPAASPRAYLRARMFAGSTWFLSAFTWVLAFVLCIGGWFMCAALRRKYRQMEETGQSSSSVRQLVRYSSSACVAVLSFLLQPLLCSLSTGESAPTADEATRGVMLKVALAQAFLVVGADSFADLRIHWLSQGTKGWFGSGSVADLSTSWYQTVGGPLSLTLAGVAAVPLFTRLFYTSHRARGLSHALTQLELNAAFAGPHFAAGLEWGNLLAVVLVALTYGAGYPFLLLIATLRVLAQLLWDRDVLLRRTRKHAHLGATVAMAAAGLLRLGLFLHCIVAFWQLSYFVTPSVEQKTGTKPAVQPASNYDRSARFSGTRYFQADAFGALLLCLAMFAVEVTLIAFRAFRGTSAFVAWAERAYKRKHVPRQPARTPGSTAAPRGPGAAAGAGQGAPGAPSAGAGAANPGVHNPTANASANASTGHPARDHPGGHGKDPAADSTATQEVAAMQGARARPVAEALERPRAPLGRAPTMGPVPMQAGQAGAGWQDMRSGGSSGRWDSAGARRGSRGARMSWPEALLAGVVRGPLSYALTDEPLYLAREWARRSRHGRLMPAVDANLPAESGSMPSDPVVARVLASSRLRRIAALPKPGLGMADKGDRSRAEEREVDEVDEVLLEALGENLTPWDLDMAQGLVRARLQRGLGLDGVDLVAEVADARARHIEEDRRIHLPLRIDEGLRMIDPEWISLTDITPAAAAATLTAPAQFHQIQNLGLTAWNAAARAAPALASALQGVAQSVLNLAAGVRGQAWQPAPRQLPAPLPPRAPAPLPPRQDQAPQGPSVFASLAEQATSAARYAAAAGAQGLAAATEGARRLAQTLSQRGPAPDPQRTYGYEAEQRDGWGAGAAARRDDPRAGMGAAGAEAYATPAGAPYTRDKRGYGGRTADAYEDPAYQGGYYDQSGAQGGYYDAGYDGREGQVQTGYDQGQGYEGQGYYDEQGGYYDEQGGYYDAQGGYYDAQGGYYDAQGGYYDQGGNYTPGEYFGSPQEGDPAAYANASGYGAYDGGYYDASGQNYYDANGTPYRR